MAGRLLPVDRAAVHARAVVGERLELGAFAEMALRLDPEHRLAVHHLRAAFAQLADIGGDQHAPANPELALLPDQAERRPPADPGIVDPDGAAPIGLQHDRGGEAVRRPLAIGGEAEGRLGRAADPERELGGARPAAGEAGIERDGEALADPGLVRRRRGHRRRTAADAEDHVERAAGEQEGEQEQPARPPGRRRQRDQQRERRDRPGQQDGKAGRVDQRGASVSSIRRPITSSTGRPSISAAAERRTRWRSTGRASALTSSGMT